MDLEQLAFIEKSRQRASRGVVVALDGTRGDIVLTVRVGDFEKIDLRARDTTGAARKQRLAIGDRVTVAIEYRARDVQPGAGGAGVSGDLVAPGASVEGSVTSVSDIVVVDCGVPLLIARETMPSASEGDSVRFVVADEGKAYLIPTR